MGQKNNFLSGLLSGAGIATGIIITIFLVSFLIGNMSFSTFGGNTNETGEPIYVSGVLLSKGSNTKINDTIYISSDLSDWEPVTPVNGVFSTARTYRMGSDIYVFYPGSSTYYASLLRFTVPQVDPSKSSTSIGLVEIYAKSTSMSVVAQDQSGSTLSNSASGWLNTTSGTTSTIRAIIQNSAGNTAFGDPRWTTIHTEQGTFNGYSDLNTGYEYIGPFAIIKTNTSSIVIQGAISSLHVGSYYYYFIRLNPDSLWNNNDISNDGIQVFGFDITPTADATVSIEIYDTVRSDFIGTASFGTPDASTTFIVNVIV